LSLLKKASRILCFFFCLSLPLHAAVTGVTALNIPNTTYEATTTNNLALHLTVQTDGGADTLSSISLDNVAPYLQAVEPDDLAAVRLLLDSDGNTANGATNLGAFTVDGTQLHWDLTLASPPTVSNGDHLYIMMDVQGPASLMGGQRLVRMQVPASGITFASSGAFPPSPIGNGSNLYLTSQIPPALYNVTLTDSMPSTIGVGQIGVPVFQLNFSSDTAAGHEYDSGIFIKSVRLRFYDGAVPIDPSTAISSMSVSSPSDETEYFSTNSVSSYVLGDDSLSIPLTEIYSEGPQFDPNWPNSFVFMVDLLPSVTLSSLQVVAEAATDIVGQDIYSSRDVPAAGAFPLVSSTAAFQQAATVVTAAFSSSGAATQVSKGSAGNLGFQLILNNPGAANTGIAQLNGFDFTLTDALGNPVTATSALRWLRVDDGRFTYLSRSVTESTDNTLHCDHLILPVNLAVGNPVTLNVRYDVLSGALPYDLRFHATSFAAWDVTQAGSSNPVSVTGALPFDGPTVPLVALFNVTHASTIPTMLLKGQKDVPLMDLTLQHPGPAPVGPIVVRSITFRAKDRDGNALTASGVLSDPRLMIGSTRPAQSAAFSADQVTITLTNGVTLTSSAPGNTATLSLRSDIVENLSVNELQIQLASAADLVAQQPADTTRAVYAQALADTYPMSTSTVPLQAINLKDSFTNFPNPFRPTVGPTRLTYWLEQAGTVDLRVFSLSGTPVRKLVTGAARPAGLNALDTWDGRNDSGQMVLNGVYLVVLETDVSGKKTTAKRYVAVAK